MSFTTADLFGPDDEPAYPSAYDYYRSPSLQNARTFLEAAGLYVPYEARRLATASNTVGLGGPRSARRGGAKRPRTRTATSASASAPDSEPTRYSDDVSIFQRADFLHDVYTQEPMDDDLAHRILEVGIQIPKGLLRRLRQHCHSEDSREYTAQALKTLQKHFGFVPKTLRVTELKSDRDRDQAVPVIRREHIRADAYMSETVADWLTPNEHGVAEIVFDGILEDPLRRPVSEGVHKVSHLRSLATCAFLQWMIGEWPEPYRIAGGTLREIRFLTGTFQTLDVAGHDAFLNRWVGYLKRDCSALKAVALIRVARIEVSSVQSGTPGVGLAPDDAALVVDGARVPFVAKALPNVPERSDWNDLDMTYRLDRFLSKAPARQITYAKRDLVEMFSEYTKFTQAQRLDPRVETVVQRVIAVNSFRDAFKADVALARGAVYLTVDRLALVYYELRRRAQRADSRGLSLLTGDKDGGMIVLGAYSS